MKKLLPSKDFCFGFVTGVLVLILFILYGCGGGGGGGSAPPNTTPVIEDAYLAYEADPTIPSTIYVPLDRVVWVLQVFDPDLDVKSMTATVYDPSDMIFDGPTTVNLPDQPSTVSIYISTTVYEIVAPFGEWRVEFTVQDSVGNISKIFEVNFFVI